MSYREAYVVPSPQKFGGLERRREKAHISILGVPLDSTASYRPGQRFGPLYVRAASPEIESNAYSGEGFLEEVPFYDEGDVTVAHGDVPESLERTSRVVQELLTEGRRVALLGGEHTITVGALRGLKAFGARPCLLVFDAHLDLREDYLGVRLSHASTFRRALEILGEVPTVFIGARAFSREELALARSRSNIEVITPRALEAMGTANVISKARRALSDCKAIYLSVDLDVYDPSYAPGVGNPEPPGLSPREVLPLISALVDDRFLAVDVVELSPPYDAGGITAVLAAKTLQEILISLASRTR
ncbi:MAG: agmatinase [Acidilobaceae archaeon]|nr:agmatinase [Acidilobaceae archaeon]